MLSYSVRYVEESPATVGEAGLMHHRRIISVVALLLTLSACSWGQTLGNSGRTGWNSLPGAISPENVSTLHYLWKPVDGTFLAALDNDFAYGAGSSDSAQPELHTYSAGGTNGCSGSPRVCTPVWIGDITSDPLPAQGPNVPSSPAVDAHYVYISEIQNHMWRLLVFDRLGRDGCNTATPRRCAPIGVAAVASEASAAPSLTLADDNVYVSTRTFNPLVTTTIGIRRSALVGCAGTSACAPFMTVTTDAIANMPAVDGGRLYLRTYGGAGIFDARGIQGCTNGICSALAYLQFPLSVTEFGVSRGRVYVQDRSDLRVFDAAGIEGCSRAPVLCDPIWTTNTGARAAGGFAVLITPNVVVVPINLETRTELRAYDAHGVTGCNPTTRVCEALWRVPSMTNLVGVIGAGNVGLATDAAAGSPGTFSAFRLDGLGCAGVPLTCPSLYNGAQLPGIPTAVAFGRVVVSSPNSQVYAVG